MKLAQLLFKSKWQDKRADVRRQAIATGNDADMLAALPQLVRTDADAGVRLAALKRINDYETWRERSTGDADGGVRVAARSAYITLLCSRDTAVPALSRRIAELDTLTAAEIEKVAVAAPESALRAIALQKVTRPSLLAERAVTDPDAQIRLATLDRIHDTNMLERIAERARKTDKAVSRRARELMEASRIGAGDATAVAERARIICERLEALIRAPGAATERQQATINSEWQALGERVPAEFVARYQGADRMVHRVLEAARNPQVEKVGLSEPTSVVISALQDDAAMRPATVGLEVLASQARFDAALSAAAADAQRDRERRHAMVAELETMAPKYVAAVEAGDTAAAHSLHDEIVTLSATIGTVPAAIERKLVDVRGRYAELKRWQLWSNQQRREALCAELEVLSSAGQHPDAVATRVRAAREEWKKLDASEGTATAEGGLSRRFQALCHRAMRPTKVYFDKRDELRDSRKLEIEQLLMRASTPVGDSDDWMQLTTLRQQLSTALRGLDGIDPRERTGIAKRLKDSIGVLSPRIEAFEQNVEKAKRRLIERAVALAQTGDQRSAARDTRELQQQWKAAGNGRRSLDQRLWQEFRTACDSVFQKLDAAREQRDVQVAAARTQVQDLLIETEAFAAEGLQGNVDAAKSKLRDLDSRWQTLSSDDRSLEQRFRRSRDSIAMAIKDDARRQRLSRYDLALEKYTLLRSLEKRNTDIETFSSRWNEMQPTPLDFASAIQTRHIKAMTPEQTDGDSSDEVSRELLIQLEYLGGLDSPAEDRALRMTQQVQRLSARLREGAAKTPEEELSALFNRWFEQSPQSEDLEARFLHSAKAAIAALP